MPTQFIDLNGVIYAFAELGSGPLVIFGHGMMFDRTMFAAQSVVLSKAARCVMIDWPGHGNSGYQQGGWSDNDLVLDTIGLIQAFGGRPAILVGLSQGGRVFAEVALARPELVRALVICGTRPGPRVDPDGSDDFSNRARARLPTLGPVLAHGSFDQRERAFDELLPIMFGATSLNSRQELITAARQTFARHDRNGINLAMNLRRILPSIVERLGQLQAPTQIIWGMEDRVSPPWGAGLYKEGVPHARVDFIEKAGHATAIEEPDVTSLLLKTFLSDFL